MIASLRPIDSKSSADATLKRGPFTVFAGPNRIGHSYTLALSQ